MIGAKIAAEVSRLIHRECRDVPHDIGIKVMNLILEHYHFHLSSGGKTAEQVFSKPDLEAMVAIALACQARASNVPADVRRLLESCFWLPTLLPNTRYARLHDDDDGKGNGWLFVTIGEHGDAWIETTGAEGLRFRMPLYGGGASQYTRTALVILAEAIRLDNEQHPMRPGIGTVTHEA